jgi:hypothetical protein
MLDSDRGNPDVVCPMRAWRSPTIQQRGKAAKSFGRVSVDDNAGFTSDPRQRACSTRALIVGLRPLDTIF